MRTDPTPALKLGDRVTITEGVYADLDGEVVEVVPLVRPWAGRARLRLPEPHGEVWHPFWSDPMDEAEWLTTRDTAAMRRYLDSAELLDRGRWRLFLVGCARAIFPRIQDESFRAACQRLIESSERAAAGVESRWALASAVFQAKQAFPVPSRRADHPEFAAGNAILRACDVGLGDSPDNWVFRQAGLGGDDLRGLLRCVFGNPFRATSLEPDWLAWQSGTVPALARQIYDEGRFGEMPVLGDALEDAGCADEAILGHCRSPIHTRGCWLLDAILS